jgi:hypothetical protein
MMNDEQTPKPITRREFYQMTGMIYMFIGLVAFNTGHMGNSILSLVLGSVGVFCGFFITIQALKEKNK